DRAGRGNAAVRHGNLRELLGLPPIDGDERTFVRLPDIGDVERGQRAYAGRACVAEDKQRGIPLPGQGRAVERGEHDAQRVWHGRVRLARQGRGVLGQGQALAVAGQHLAGGLGGRRRRVGGV